MLKRRGESELKAKDDPGKVVAATLTALCVSKTSVVSSEDVTVIFGV